jgi:hypothetical protein
MAIRHCIRSLPDMITKNDKGVAEVFIDSGADPFALNDAGQTPADMALRALGNSSKGGTSSPFRNRWRSKQRSEMPQERLDGGGRRLLDSSCTTSHH